MKKIVLTLLCVAAMLPNISNAQQYKSFTLNSGKDNPNGIVYNLPKTDLVVTFKVEKTTRTKGIYADNAYLLGIDNAALKNTVSYRIVSADIREQIAADVNKRYILVADDKVSVEKSPMGTIKSIITKGNSTAKFSKDNNLREDNPSRHENNFMPLPNNTAASLAVQPTYEKRLMQEGLLVKYPQMTAEKAVAEIKRLREKQIELLSGGWEGTYMNTTVDFMYKQLDEIISSYVALFTGIETTVTEEYVFVITPEKPIILEEDLLVPVCKFSTTNGLMDLSEKGEGIKINARIHSYLSTDENAKITTDKFITDKQKSNMDREGTGIYYAVPQTVKVTLQGADMINVSKIVKLMQYGSVSFTSSHTNNILFDENTGELIRTW
ncbi:MAG: DUF4831 family protein [Bacteroidales bacterium]|nr:DUF4831 family protein [Bacteroidales bacterium]